MIRAQFDLLYNNKSDEPKNIISKLCYTNCIQICETAYLKPTESYLTNNCFLFIPTDYRTTTYFCDECGEDINYSDVYTKQIHIPPQLDFCANCIPKQIRNEEKFQSRNLDRFYIESIKPVLNQILKSKYSIFLTPKVLNFTLFEQLPQTIFSHHEISDSSATTSELSNTDDGDEETTQTSESDESDNSYVSEDSENDFCVSLKNLSFQ